MRFNSKYSVYLRSLNSKSFRSNARTARSLSSLPTSNSFNILFLGRDEFSVLVLEQLYQHRDVWSKISVATHPDEKTGRNGSKLSVSPLKIKGLSLGLETHLIPHHKGAFKDWQPPAQFQCSPSPSNNMLITASFGRMIHNKLLHLFPDSRRLNVHPSLIPLYRGPAPIQHTIADGRDETGVCVLEMKEKKFGADGGEVWSKKALPVPPQISFPELRDSLAVEGGILLVSVLRDMLAGTATASPQDDSQASHAPFITQDTAMVDFHSWDAQKIQRMYRAIGHQKPIVATLPSMKTLQLHSPIPFVKASLPAELPKPLRALRAPGEATYDPMTHMLAIRCANDTFIHVPSLKQQDKKQLSAQDWWKGVRPEWLDNRVMRLGRS